MVLNRVKLCVKISHTYSLLPFQDQQDCMYTCKQHGRAGRKYVYLKRPKKKLKQPRWMAQMKQPSFFTTHQTAGKIWV